MNNIHIKQYLTTIYIFCYWCVKCLWASISIIFLGIGHFFTEMLNTKRVKIYNICLYIYVQIHIKNFTFYVSILGKKLHDQYSCISELRSSV